MNEIDELLEIMSRLRDPEQGCPWDRTQTIDSILPHTMEEVRELADAIERNVMDDLCDELGDLLFHIVFYAQIAGEEGYFDFRDVASGVTKKLYRRHPHVFADEQIDKIEDLNRSWENIKSAERREKEADREHHGLLEGIGSGLPEISRSLKMQRRAAGVGFDWQDPGQVLEKIEEELRELRGEMQSEPERKRLTEEFGDLMFSCINLARHLNIDPDLALSKTNNKFKQRFDYMEKELLKQNRSLRETTSDEMEALWQEAKNNL